MTLTKIVAPKKLIEVALPLDDINKAAAREKSIRHGHPSTLHLWWARRPLAAARAVLFAQLVNDPSWKYSEEELKKPQVRSAITRKRKELFRLITEMVKWENTTNEDVLGPARAEIRASWKETCEANKEHPDAKRLFDPEKLPAFHDPFAGGGALPLEAQRLGLEAHATDLNPVAVLINKAMIEIPPRFAGRSPIGPVPKSRKQTNAKSTEEWSGAKGLAEDVRRYGTWMRDELEKRVGNLYPKVKITKDLAQQRPDLAPYEGRELSVIAWLWARSVVSPNPSAKGARVPLVSNFFLSTKGPTKTWLEPRLTKSRERPFRFVICRGDTPGEGFVEETVNRRGAICLLTRTAIPFTHIREEGRKGELGFYLLAMVLKADASRVYVVPDELSPALASKHSDVTSAPSNLPIVELPEKALGFRVQQYGITKWSQLFLPRQAALLSALGDLLPLVHGAASSASGPDYADALTTILALCVSKMAVFNNAIGRWRAGENKTAPAFGRQTLSMIWDTPEVNPFAGAGGDWLGVVEAAARVLEQAPAKPQGAVAQRDAGSELPLAEGLFVISSDPPYYDNVAYADLSDFSYYWLRQHLRVLYPELLATIVTPKDDEIIADPFRRGNEAEARRFFMRRMGEALLNMRKETSLALPITLYYAFKQTKDDDDGDDGDGSDNTTGVGVSAGWETFLEGLATAGLAVTGTWPMRTEGKTRLRGQNANALASSIVLVCRPRTDSASVVSRRDFLRELSRTLPNAIAEMTADPIASIAPADLAQACIGPGMAIFSRHVSVLEADGSSMTVHNALVHINKAIDEYYAHVEGDLDADTRFCIGWFEQCSFEPGEFGKADVLARAKGTSVDRVREAGVVEASKGKVRLLAIKDLPKKWDPTTDSRTPIWEALHHMCRALAGSEGEAGALLAKMPQKQDAIRQLAYRLYTLCAERNRQAELGRPYNELITSWPAIVEASQKAGLVNTQLGLLEG